MPSRLTDMSASEIRSRFLSGEVSAREITDLFLENAARFESSVDAFLLIDEEGARRRADELDRRRARGDELGALAAVPVAVKDNMCTRGLGSTCASRILGHFVPPYDASVVRRLQDEDAVILGKTNLDEFAMGSSTENSGFKVTRNPWDVERAPGGSSGGSAVAVAARMAPLSLGSDTGGSIRQPAALCGVVGIKPTYGRVSRYGLVAFASSLDQIGPFARSVEDAAMLLQVVSGHDPLDSTSANMPVPDYAAEMRQPVRGMKIGLPSEFFIDGIEPEVRARIDEAVQVYSSLGAEIVDVSLPHSRIDLEGGQLSSYAVATYYIVATAEASSNLARYDGVRYGHRAEQFSDMIDMYEKTRGEGFGEEVKRRIMLGTFVLSSGFYDAYYLKASKVRTLIRQDFDKAFETADVLLAPATPTPAFRIGEKTADPIEMYLSDIFTISCNLAGIAGMAVPCGFTSSGLPVGMQLFSRHWDEAGMLRAGHAYQQATDHHLQSPPLIR